MVGGVASGAHCPPARDFKRWRSCSRQAMEIVQPSRVNNSGVSSNGDHALLEGNQERGLFGLMDHGYGTRGLVFVSSVRRRTLCEGHSCGMLDIPRLDAFVPPARNGS